MTGGMMFKGTPGPWILCTSDDETKTYIQESKENNRHPHFASIRTDSWWGNGEGEANANLIAAAPELLEALQKIVKDLEMRAKNGVVDCSHGVYYEAHTAIAKALGEQK